MAVDRFISQNNQITLFGYTYMPTTGMGVPETGTSFY